MGCKDRTESSLFHIQPGWMCEFKFVNFGCVQTSKGCGAVNLSHGSLQSKRCWRGMRTTKSLISKINQVQSKSKKLQCVGNPANAILFSLYSLVDCW